MNNKINLKFILLIHILWVYTFCLAQDSNKEKSIENSTYTFTTIPDSTVTNEVATFCRKAIDEKQRNEAIGLKLVPLKKNTNGNMSFYSFFGRVGIYIDFGKFDTTKHRLSFSENRSISIDGASYWTKRDELPNADIASIIFEIGQADRYLPGHALHGIVGMNCWDNTPPECKVYLSNDKRRIYIYLLNEQDSASYEVTWVIKNSKYRYRIADVLNNK